MPNASAKADPQGLFSAEMTRAFEFRSDALSFTREYYRKSGFVEVTTPCAIHAPAPEEYIDCPKTSEGLFLRSSPELEMKRLLASGMKNIYEISPCFRVGEFGRTHRPEFTMLEWYMAGKNYRDMLDFTHGLFNFLAEKLRVPEKFYDPAKEWEILGVREAFRRFAGVSADECAETEGRFETVLVEKVEPALPKDIPCVLIDYPVRFGALARRKPEAPTLVERWELYLHGIELANAYGELTAAKEQRERFAQFNRKREEYGLCVYPEASEFLAAVDHGLPDSTGCALGFDRLLLVLSGKNDLADVCFPV